MSWDDAIDGVDRDTPGGRIPRALRIERRIGGRAANDDPASNAPAYAELHCLSDFSFLRGASCAEDLFTRAAQCGYQALAITDECSLAGIVRAHQASKATGIQLIVGAEFKLEDGLRCVLLVQDMPGYTALCRLITTARCAAEKGEYRLTRADVERQFGVRPDGAHAERRACLLPSLAEEGAGHRADLHGEPQAVAGFLPPLAGEGRDGGAFREEHPCATQERPHPNPPPQMGEGSSHRIDQRSEPQAVAGLLPPLAGEGRDGGAFREGHPCATQERPHPNPPPQAGEGSSHRTDQRSEPQAVAGLLPPLAGEGRDGGAFREGHPCATQERPHPTPPPRTGEGATPQAGHGSETQDSIQADAAGLFALWLPGNTPDPAEGTWLRSIFGHRAYLAVELHRDRDDAARLRALLQLADTLGMVPVATGDAHMATRRERVLQDTITAIRHGLPLAEAGAHLFPNGERHLRSRRALGNVYAAVPGGQALLQAAVDIGRQCTFSMDEVKYVYPRELVPEGETPTTWLRTLVKRGMAEKWPHGVPLNVVRDIGKELALIAELQYEAFFLTVHDIVCFARSRDILCQGRGSSANSAVCYVLGITSVNPAESRLLMARFLSRARKEPPDIDVDFEHERREEVLQYIYAKYGRERAALAATVIRYRGKSAVRDVARAFGLPQDQIALLAECFGWGNGEVPMEQRLRESGFDPDTPLIARVMAVTAMLKGHPRHLSQHVGGFIISDAPLWHLVPVENAAMADRTVIQWEKDDLETLGLLKVDCLALGMLTCIRKALELVRRHRGRDLCIATIPAEDPDTYQMIQAADTVGVFQIESRAQMSMLPRLKPARFFDLVVEVAIVRPGPIQGGMVHPYLRRRMGTEPVTYPSEGIRDILGPTLGVPLFQEQVMELMIHAGYTEEEADNLRRSMAAWRQGGDMDPHRARIRQLMSAKGYAPEFIEQIFEQIKGFGSYGFPQSHAASFAKLVYASCWLKRHEPAAFACALLNAQPMGFYSPSQIVQDARRAGAHADGGGREAVEFLPVDVCCSDWDNTLVDKSASGNDWAMSHKSDCKSDCGSDFSRELFASNGIVAREAKSSRLKSLLQKPTLLQTRLICAEARVRPQPAIRLGLRQIQGLSQAAASAIVAARMQRPFHDVADVCQRADLDARARTALAEAGAFRSLAGNRNTARWEVAGIERAAALQRLGSPGEAPLTLPEPGEAGEVVADYRALGLSLGAHPLALLRDQLQARRLLGSRELHARRHGSHVHTAGLVTQRQRPATAQGTTFVTLEDEHGMVNVVVWQALAARRRKVLLGARLLSVRGRWERVDGVEHLIASDLQDLSPLLGSLHAGQLHVASRDFR